MNRTHLFLLTITLASCKTVQHVADVENVNIRVDSAYVSMGSIDQMILPYKAELEEEMDVVIGEVEEELIKGKLNSSMGNFFSDLLHEEGSTMTEGDIAFAINNYGGLRIPSIAKGPVTKSKIFELMPFDNTMVVLHLSGQKVEELCNRIAEYGGWPVSYSLHMNIEGEKATNITIHGEPLDSQKTYHVVTTDYIANGGDKCSFLKSEERENTGVFIREVFISGILRISESGQTLVHNPSVRITKL